MEIENLINNLNRAADDWEEKHPVTYTGNLRVQDALRDAASALSALQAENEKLRSDVIRFNDILASYQNVLVPELRAELEKVKAERDYSVNSWKGFCAKCEWNGKQYLSDGKMDDRCKTCRENGKINWEWRGQKED